MADIRVDKYDINLTGTSGTFAITDVGDISRAFIRINGATSKGSAGPIGNTGDATPASTGCRLEITATNVITFTKGAAGSVKMMFEVWVYVGGTGKDYEFIVRDRGSIQLNATTSASSGVIGSIVSDNKCIPFHTGYDTAQNSINDFNNSTLALEITSNEVIASRRPSSGLINCGYEVVEFIGAAWVVGHAKSTSHDTIGTTWTNINITDSASGVGSSLDINNWSEAMIIEGTMEGDTTELGLADIYIVARPNDANTTQIQIKLGEAAARNDGSALFHILHAGGIVVNRSGNDNFVEGNNTYGANLTVSGVNGSTLINELSLEWFVTTTGTGTAHARGSVHAQILDPNAALNYTQGAPFESTDYISTLLGVWEFTGLIIPATPSGVLVEAGGTGTGMFIGWNDGGDFIARGGNGASLAPADCARLVIPTSTYDFGGKSGRLRVEIDPTTNDLFLGFDEGNTGSYDYQDTIVASSAFANWSGADSGFVGNSNANIAGSEITSNYVFNGTIGNMAFSQVGGGGGLFIKNWVHKSGNNVAGWYGVVDLSNLEDAVVVGPRREYSIL